MAASTIQSGNIVTRFKKKVLREYVREGRFGPVTGTDENKVIQIVRELKKCSIPLVSKLNGSGVRGSTQLSGSEEALSNYAYLLTPTYHRNGVLIDNEEREKSEFDLFKEARPSLMNWIMETKRDQCIQAFGAIEAGGTYYNYGGTAASGATGSTAATAGNMDTWNTNNTDRILYGTATSNYSAGDHTASLAAVASTETLDAATVELLKRKAMDADPLIRPIMVKGDEPWFVYYVGKYDFRNLRNDSVMSQANREARARNLDNPLFAGGDLLWDGVVIKEVPDLDKFIDSTGSGLWDGVWGANCTGDDLRTADTSSARISMGFFCGAQALGFGIGRTASFKRRKEDDYEHLNGVAISCKHDIKKTFYNNKQHGMITTFCAAALDT